MEKLLTPQEERCVELLAESWNKFLELPILHEWHQTEFMQAIHQAQRIILARPYHREQNKNDNEN